MEEGRFTSDELLDKAMDLLSHQYDPENDSFFVVVTQGGKDDSNIGVGAQAIIGELNLKTVSAFIVQVVAQLCATLGIHPFVFVSRHIIAHFVDSERETLHRMIAAQASNGGIEAGEAIDLGADSDLIEKLVSEQGEEDEDAEPIFIISSHGMSDVEN